MSHSIAKGQKLKMSDLGIKSQLRVAIAAKANSNLVFDVSCFGVDANQRLSDDRYFVFYNQKSSPQQEIKSLGPQQGDLEQFSINLDQLPPAIHKLVFTLTIDGTEVMSSITQGHVKLFNEAGEVGSFQFTGKEFANERAVIIAEIYRKDGWRFAAVGQGFNGGLSALLKHFGGEEAPSNTPTPPAPVQAPVSAVSDKRVLLEKQIEKQAPQLISLVKQAKISLEKVGLQDHQAKVALCLDASGSMGNLYSSGLVQKFAERILALGCRFDDDGAIDVFFFADRAAYAGEMKIGNLTANLINQKLAALNVGGGTAYAPAMKTILDFYFRDQEPNAGFFKMFSQKQTATTPSPATLPVYVMFVTDGDTGDQALSESYIKQSSQKPIFWQFMSIGSGTFRFLEKLDTMPGRYLDNANFFNVVSPTQIPDAKLYDLLMQEYPSWVKQATDKGLLR